MSKIYAGSYDVDRWLYGGYETDIVTVIYGASGTGKTNFCLLAAVSQAGKGNKVLYIDTEGGFSVERVKQLALENADKILGNILLLKPTNFEEQRDIFKKLEEHLRKQISLIVVDGMTILYRLEFALAREKEEKGIHKINAELINQMRALTEIARKREIPVIVTNQVYRWDEMDRMVGGDILKYWAKCLIEITNEKGKRVAHLRKHRSLPEKEMDFVIVNDGIKKRGWI